MKEIARQVSGNGTPCLVQSFLFPNIAEKIEGEWGSYLGKGQRIQQPFWDYLLALSKVHTQHQEKSPGNRPTHSGQDNFFPLTLNFPLNSICSAVCISSFSFKKCLLNAYYVAGTDSSSLDLKLCLWSRVHRNRGGSEWGVGYRCRPPSWIDFFLLATNSM